MTICDSRYSALNSLTYKDVLAIILMENTVDNAFIQLLNNEFTEEEQRQFVNRFHTYLQYGSDLVQFAVDLDDVYEWMGYSRKSDAKKVLRKYFSLGIDYTANLLRRPAEQVHGGHNKEKVLMNIQTFKELCMLANTERGKSTRLYYVKMENMFFKYMSDKHTNLIQEMEMTMKLREERSKHDTLLATLDKKRTIYLTRVKIIDATRFVVKLGYSDGIAERNRSHTVHFGTSLLDVFECDQNREFELFLKRHPKVSMYAYTEPIKDEVRSSETYLVTLTEYQSIVDLIKKNIKNYQGLNPEALIEMERLNVTNKILDLIKDEKLSNENAQLMLQKLNCITPNNPIQEIEDQQVEEQSKNLIGRSGTNRKIQAYDPETLKLVSTFNGIMEVLRKHPHMSKFGVQNAAYKNTVYHGFRWFYLERSQENKEYQIPPTIDANSSIPRLVAMLDKDKSRIEIVYENQQKAMEGIGITRKQTINDAIKKDRLYKNSHYFAFYDECSEELKREYLSRACLPQQSSKGTTIHQIDINSKEVIMTYTSIADVLKKVCISRASLKRACETQEAHAGYMWAFADKNTVACN